MENEQQENTQEQPATFSDKLIALRHEWTKTITDLSKELTNLNTIEKLTTVIYTKRQEAVELHYTIMGMYLQKQNQYKSKTAELYNNFKLGNNGIRYSSDSAIYLQCEAILMDQKSIIDELKNFAEFMWESVRTIDNILYGMKERVRIHEIQHGIKF